jgi:aspartate/methionine/tyrosine aminotransferase
VAELTRLQEVLRDTSVVVISDEVYEHMVYGGEHQGVARFPELAARSIIVSSFGKTYHVTGWKVGYAAAPAALMAEFRKVHQFNVFTVNTPMQHGPRRLHGQRLAPPGAARLLPCQARPLRRRLARIAFKRGAYLRNFVYAFAEMTSDRLTRPLVERAMSGEADDYQL